MCNGAKQWFLAADKTNEHPQYYRYRFVYVGQFKNNQNNKPPAVIEWNLWLMKVHLLLFRGMIKNLDVPRLIYTTTYQAALIAR